MQWLFMTLVAAACICARYAPVRDRRIATGVMTALLVTWALYLLAWSSTPPASAFWALGIALTSEHLWLLTDVVLGTAVIAAAWHRWWGWTIFAMLGLQQCFHVAYDFGAVTFPQLSLALDMSFLVQLACFFVIGGPGVADRLSRLVRLRRGVFHPAGSALRAEE